MGRFSDVSELPQWRKALKLEEACISKMEARLKKKNGLSKFCVIFFVLLLPFWNLLHRESKVERELLNLIEALVVVVVVDVVLQRERAFEKKIGAYR
jgi:hypothetical protein